MNSESELLEFGTKRENEERRDGGCGMAYDPARGLWAAARWQNGFLGPFGGGVDEGEDIRDGVLRELVEESGLYDFSHIELIDTVVAHYYHSVKEVSRVTQTTCFLTVVRTPAVRETKLEEHEKFVLEWVAADDMITNWKARNELGDNDHLVYFLEKCIARVRELGFSG